ncbi:hypothetical protein LINGRAHAP2_LOCUS15625, partial [Linum grandiflorum]
MMKKDNTKCELENDLVHTTDTASERCQRISKTEKLGCKFKVCVK